MTVPAERVGLVPDSLDPVDAAALPVATTAVTALRAKAGLRPGERLLVRGAAGGVGNAAVQLGRAYGAEVTALARAANLDLVRELGAHEAVDHRSVRPADLGRFDVVLDTVGTELRSYRRLLNPGGRMVTIAFDLGRPVTSLGYVAGSALHGRGRVRFFSGNPGSPTSTPWPGMSPRACCVPWSTRSFRWRRRPRPTGRWRQAASGASTWCGSPLSSRTQST